ncbi:hypothetical protein HK096_008204, partial [Nowakowskiella sp. JEL0078]
MRSAILFTPGVDEQISLIFQSCICLEKVHLPVHTDVAFDGIGYHPNITNLVLDGARELTDEGLCNIVDACPNLVELKLASASIGESGLVKLNELGELRILSLPVMLGEMGILGMSVSPNCLYAVIKCLPQLQILEGVPAHVAAQEGMLECVNELRNLRILGIVKEEVAFGFPRQAIDKIKNSAK